MAKSSKNFDRSSNVDSLTTSDTIVYIYELLASLQKLATHDELKMLAHLIELAKIEAKQCPPEEETLPDNNCPCDPLAGPL